QTEGVTMKKMYGQLLVAVSLSAGLAGCAFAQPSATPGGSTSNPTLEQKVASVLPTKAEDRWLDIPWHADLMEARAEAERQGKPLFLWIMDGNPLACG
ncbi:MAG: thioredoxin family protein, partial [Armatimonadota bacterium]|nr:thioredoxin family protein [Armatimonadota bacterium]